MRFFCACTGKYMFMYPDWLKGNCCLFFRESKWIFFIKYICEVLKDNIFGLIILKMNIYYLVANSSRKGAAKIFTNGCKVEPNRTSI